MLKIPFSIWSFYLSLLTSLRNLVLRPTRSKQPCTLSRGASLVFLVDQPACYVWPYFRSEPYPNSGPMLAQRIVMGENPTSKARKVPRSKTKNDQEFLASTGE